MTAAADVLDSEVRVALTMIDQAVYGADQDMLPAGVTVVEQLWADGPVRVGRGGLGWVGKEAIDLYER